MLRKIGLTIAYFLSTLYIFLIVSPALYCYQHGCHGPEADGFMPAFFLTPLAGITTAVCLFHAIQNIRKGDSRSWIFWPLAIVFAIVLLGVMAFIGMLVYFLAFHGGHH